TGSCYQKNLVDAGMWGKKINVQQHMVEGSKWIELDERLARQDDEKIVYKNYASAFFGTPLQSILVANRIDTLIVSGCVTSGCIRATVVDGVSSGYRVIVPKQCVGDRHEVPHEANLFDIDTKYGDVVDVEEVIGFLNGLT
ncbi:MAG: isochorismatase family protein, partial [Candidatus Omnitrophica bacterium]|nr:isochorismatase family protein [Candidatus Omnitrophota bacterium]